MKKYIPLDDLVAEIERRIKDDEMVMDHDAQITELLSRELNTLYELSSFIKSIEVKESKLPNPRFPHLDNIVDKVFGTGNLDSFEYEEAKQLVLLTKEELLKDLEAKEVDFDALGVLAEHLIACDAHLVTPKYTDKELNLLEELAKNNKAQKGK